MVRACEQVLRLRAVRLLQTRAVTIFDAASIREGTIRTVKLARTSDLAGADSLGGLLSMDNATALLRVRSKGRVTHGRKNTPSGRYGILQLADAREHGG